MNNFFKLIFDNDECICLTSNKMRDHYCKLEELSNLDKNVEYFCINPARQGRKYKDITKFRNFLIELDDLKPDKQLRYILDIGLPYSAITFSGNKSLHFVISLEETIESLDKYKFLSNWIHNIVEKADHQTKNCNRLSRVPNVVRSDTGKEQKLMYLGKRISTSRLFDWLETHIDKIPKKRNTVRKSSGHTDRSKVVEVMSWYLDKYLNIDYIADGIHVQCPMCASEGKDNHKDNMYVSGENMRFHCFANDSHNSLIFSKILSLRG